MNHSELEITRAKIEDRTVNYVHVIVYVENGCDVNEGEYSINLVGLLGSLDLNSYGGVDDISLIKEAIDNFMLEGQYRGDVAIDIVLKESGEWEDVFWHKYYIVERSTVQKL